jgi:hypothetical protein
LSNHACIFFFSFPFLRLYSPIRALAAFMKFPVSLQLLDLGQLLELLGRVISSSQGLYLYTNTEKRTHNTNTKHSCPRQDSNPHDHSVRASEDSSCLRPRGYCDRLASEQAKTVHALDRAATVTSLCPYSTRVIQ